MKNDPAVTHRQFVSYLLNLDKTETLETIKDLRQEDTVIDLLFALLEDLKQYVQDQHPPQAKVAAVSFSEIEELLLRLYSGNYNPKEAQRFVQALKTSPRFYHRVLAKLRQLAWVSEVADIPEMHEVQIKSDEDILADYILPSAYRQTRTQVTAPEKKPKNILDKLKSLHFPPNPVPKYAVALAVLLALVIFTPNIFLNLQKQGLFDQYLIPAEYEGSTLRAGSPVSDADADERNFSNRFELSMADFLTGNYLAAIENFHSMEKVAEEFESKDPDERGLPRLLRDYYFFYGYSHLAVAKPGIIDFNRKDEKYHLQEAMRLISSAKTIAQQFNLDKMDRETYFLALANGLIGRNRTAIEQLQQITPESNYLRKANRLIQEWADN